MEHDIAATTYTLERYVLGELSEADRDLFEEHYFDCAECAGHLRDFSQFSAGARTVLAGQPRVFQADKPGWLDRFRLSWPRPAFAALCLPALVVLSSATAYQAGARRGQPKPQALASILLRPETRGEEASIAARALGAFLLLELDIPAAHGELQWQIRGPGSPTPLMAGAAAAPAPGDSLKLLLPASPLAPGRYLLTIRSRPDPRSGAVTVDSACRFRID
ncbi:MAG TPA: zf-HC2 domain-containing protein [Bryobacteraceae bacterium]|nr:zf-HC2 domain-containing protein [Bryobacteraceae bacterium]